MCELPSWVWENKGFPRASTSQIKWAPRRRDRSHVDLEWGHGPGPGPELSGFRTDSSHEWLSETLFHLHPVCSLWNPGHHLHALHFQRCRGQRQRDQSASAMVNGGGISQASNSKVFSFGAQKVKHLPATHCKHVSVFNMLTVLCSPAHVFRKETGYDV